MTIYADILVVTNLYIDFFLLWCVKKFLHLRAKNRRLVLGAFLGALCALTALLSLPGWLSFLIGAASALLTAAGAFAPLKPWMFWKASLCFWMFSFLLAGFFLFILRFFAPGNVAVLGNTLYFDLSPLLLFLFTCAAYAVFWGFHKLFPQENSAPRYCAVTVEHGGGKAELFAKADTGNALREPFSGLPVLVCEAEAVKAIAPPAVLCFLGPGGASSDPAPNGPGLRLVPFESMGGAGVLPAFRPDRAYVKKTGKDLDCYLAVCRQKLSAGQFNALYNPDLFPEQADP